MTTAIEPILALQWAYDVLAGDATIQGLAPGGVWFLTVGQGAGFPRLVVAVQGQGQDVISGVGGDLIWSTPLLQVRAVDMSGDYTAVSQIAARAFDLLHGAGDTLYTADNGNTGRIVSCVRTASFPLDEELGDVRVANVIQLFRVEVKSG